MKVFYTFSKSATAKHSPTFLKVLDELEKQHITVETTIRKDHLPPEMKNVEDVISESVDIYRYVHDKAIRQVIFRADALVVEASYQSFRLGFETFYALSQHKPVLVLSKFKNYGNLINQPHFFGAKYNNFTLPDEIEKFRLHVERFKLRNRFNLFISDQQKQHLEKSAKQLSVSMSDYIRKLIEIDIKN